VDKPYLIGTRGSLLALTQAGQMKDALEATSGKKFELKIIKTQGDQIVDRPLWQLEGKDFFTRELDQALLEGSVDLVIHSYKDLAGDRPAGIQLQAVTKRHFGFDVLLMRKERLHTPKEEWIIGTSSPRRISNLKRHLSLHLPHAGSPLPIRLEMLRGNVNTRIEKCLRGDFDGIVLALAGLERLALNPESLEVLQPLVEPLVPMILPMSLYPWSPGQGALAIECRADRPDQGELKAILSSLHDEKTAREVAVEKERFRAYGGGCHLAMGIACLELDDNLSVLHQRGEINDSYLHEATILGHQAELPKTTPVFIGLPAKRFDGKAVLGDQLLKKTPPQNLKVERPDGPVQWFITHPHCIEVLKQSYQESDIVFAAGEKTLKQCAAQGFWVHASADGMGEDQLSSLMNSKLLNLMIPLQSPFLSLTHQDGSSTLGSIRVGYQRIQQEVSEQHRARIESLEYFFWTSFSQYLEYARTFSFHPQARHFCGLGKTWKKFRENNIPVTPVMNARHFTQNLTLPAEDSL
jgi:hydroxymethylbilane synthase